MEGHGLLPRLQPESKIKEFKGRREGGDDMERSFPCRKPGQYGSGYYISGRCAQRFYVSNHTLLLALLPRSMRTGGLGHSS